MKTERRQESRLAIDVEQGVLVVGSRTALLRPDPSPAVVVSTYVDLVVAQRAVTPTDRKDLRDRELEELAGVLDLPPADLDALIGRELDRLLGRTAPPETRSAYRALWLAAAGAALAVAVTAAIAAAAADDADVPIPPAAEVVEPAAVEPVAPATTAPPVDVAEPTVGSVPAPIADPVPPPVGEPVGTPEVVTLPDGSTATRTESPPAEPTDEVDIDTSVVYER